MAASPTLYIVTSNHFDPTWRRCWDRPVRFGGRTLASYADIQDWYMTDNLRLARKHPEYRFEAESALVVRKYVERHPGGLAELRKLAAEGRFAVTGAGDNVVDSNMVLGESIVRNYLTGLTWVEDNLGVTPRLGVRNDAFGNCAQLPQILRGCEISWATGFAYSSLRGDYFRGLDGSAVCAATIPTVGWGGSTGKYRPCPSCRGAGCGTCAGRGIEPGRPSELPGGIDEAALSRHGVGQVRCTPEELLPNPAIVDWARKWRGRYDVRFATQEEFLPHVARLVERVDDPPEKDVHPGVELNPNNSGTWVTRIGLKQACRRQEHALLAAESLASLAALAGAKHPVGALRKTWQTLLFTMFHDAITGTHIDAANDELRDMWRDIDKRTEAIRRKALSKLARPEAGKVTVVNARGAATTQMATIAVRSRSDEVEITDAAGRRADVVACRKLSGGKVSVDFVARDVPALGAKTYAVRPARGGRSRTRVRALSKPEIRNGRFRVLADERGIVSVLDKRLGAKILSADSFRPGELVLERDEGSPWATLHPDRARMGLAPATRLVEAAAAGAFQRLTFEGEVRLYGGQTGGASAVGQAWLRFRTSVVLHRGIDRIDFVTEADWDAYNVRVRVAFPVPMRGRHIYGVPYGTLERRPYAPSFTREGAGGDWPAVEWAGVEARSTAVAVLNKGLPSYCVEDGSRGGAVLWLCVLRSPAVPVCLHEPWEYSMTAFDGMRDAGRHSFEYAVAAYAAPFAASSVVADAEAYNAGLVAVEGAPRPARWPAPVVKSRNVRLAAMKMAEKGRALVLRLHEYTGAPGSAEVALPDSVRAVLRTNLLERRGEPLRVPKGRRTVRVTLRPWEIATLRLEL